MNKMLNKLNKLVKDGIINPNDFYDISISNKIHLQGKATANNLKKYVGENSLEVDRNGIMSIETNDIRFVFSAPNSNEL